jgi:hypothetical protein
MVLIHNITALLHMVGSFLLKGNSGVNAEMAVFSTCFNISRMMTLVGKHNSEIKKETFSLEDRRKYKI